VSTSKHPKSKPGDAPRDDLRDNPGIKESMGSSIAKEPPQSIEGENTTEGDVANDTTPQGGVDPRQRGRTNR